MRLWRAIIVSLLLTLLPATGAFPKMWMPVDRYLAVRRQAKALTGKTVANAAADPTLFHNKVIELSGVVCGVASSGNNSSLILKAADQSYIVNSPDADHQINPGSRVRLLVKVGDKSVTGLTDLQLVGASWDYEVTEREKTEAARAQKKSEAWRNVRARSIGSRGRDVLVGKWRDIIGPYAKAIAGFNPKLSRAEAESIACFILEYSERYDLDPRLVVAVILAESHFRVGATSRKGAMGLGQLMPGTAAGLGVTDPYDPHQNLVGSVRLIRGHLDRLSGGARWSQLTWGDLALALASYNAGPGAVRKYGGVPPYRETRTYIARVTSIYKNLCGVR